MKLVEGLAAEWLKRRSIEDVQRFAAIGSVVEDLLVSSEMCFTEVVNRDNILEKISQWYRLEMSIRDYFAQEEFDEGAGI